ncbi:MAG TPA: methyltransferase domain-containing protein [Spirochaetia bacterium]|nr:methyltransferase domain-containing protein [Spirochaetia bacterium]
MELGKEVYFDNVIPHDVSLMIEKEVEKLVSSYRDEDPWTAELDAVMESQYKKEQYLLLNWLNQIYTPDRVLYAGSGSDILPKFVFGEEKVVHVSIENYLGWTIKYFPELGSDMMVVADNNNLPFPNQYFDLVVFFGLSTDSTKQQIIEATKVLKENGLLVMDNIVADGLDFKEVLQHFQRVFPSYQSVDRSFEELEFFTFLKC